MKGAPAEEELAALAAALHAVAIAIAPDREQQPQQSRWRAAARREAAASDLPETWRG